jgi:glycosyltransferase involved in cell wall biosynthesis
MIYGKNLRVLHSAALLRPPSGILHQMQWEQEAARKLGITWDVKMYCPVNSVAQNIVTHFDEKVNTKKIKSPFAKIIAWFQLRKNYHKWLMSLTDKYDLFILRYYVHDPFQLWFLKHCPKPVYFVHHTMEVPELAMPGGVSGYTRSKLELIIGKQCLNAVSGIIGVTNEIIEHQKSRGDLRNKQTLLYPNGIVIPDEVIFDARSDSVPELLFVANFAPWHGLDLLLKEMSQNKEQFILHLVGDLLHSDVVPARKDNRVVIHGKLTHREIITLSERCWLGLSTFGLYRKKMRQACPLKSREYLVTGLPVYADHIEVFPADFPYFAQGDANILKILNFARNMRKINKQKIYMESIPFVDKEILLREIFKSLSVHNFTKSNL